MAYTNGSPESLDQLVPPQDLEAERSVLGALMISFSAIDEAQSILSPMNFYADSHEKICAAIYEMHDKSRQVDAVTLAHELEARGQLEDVGGPSALVRIMETVPHAQHVMHYARIVREQWVRRVVIDTSVEAMRFAHDPSVPVEDILSEQDRATQCLLETGMSSDETWELSEVIKSALTQQVEESRLRLFTGFPELDDITGGIVGGNLVTLAARPSLGKTAFAITVALNIVRNGHPVLLFSLEMSKLEVGERLLSIQSGVPAHYIRRQSLNDDQHERISQAGREMQDHVLVIDDADEVKVTKMAAKIRRFKRSHQIEAVVIDYLQLIEPDDIRIVREQQVAQTMRRLKMLARALDIPILLLAQLNREVDKNPDKRPRLSQIRESGSTEQDSDQVWFLHRDDYYNQANPNWNETGAAELIVAKNRNGPTGAAKLRWSKQTMTFEDMTASEKYAMSQSNIDWG